MNGSGQRRVGIVDARIWIALALTFGVLRCSSGGGHAAADAAIASGGNGSPDAAGGAAPTDAASSVDAGGTVMCAAHATVSDPCKTLSIGTVSACGSGDGGGQPSQTGYLEIVAPDGSKRYTCATSWTEGGSGGYTFGQPDQFMSDPKSCCGGSATQVAGPTVPPPTSGGFFGAPHPPTHIKPQESAQPGAGKLRQNPFAVAVSDSTGAAAFSSALAMWQKWAGDGVAHAAPDGSGDYYFPASVLINFAILETSDGPPVVVIGPEVSLAADGSTPIGHPTLGACPGGGGAPLALMAGEIHGTTLTNHSGRFGYDKSLTSATLDDAAALFNCLGISITATTYFPPK
jgi:hypothetical protein